MLFTDTITIYNRTEDGWDRTVVEGVQWSDNYDKQNNDGRISVARYVSLTIPEGKYEGLVLNSANEEDAIFYGVVEDEPMDVRGFRISDMLKKYPKSGRILTVNDNSNRTYLKNIKVVLA